MHYRQQASTWNDFDRKSTKTNHVSCHVIIGRIRNDWSHRINTRRFWWMKLVTRLFGKESDDEFRYSKMAITHSRWIALARILHIFILQDNTLICAFEASNIVCWLVNPPIAKLDLLKSANCRWICKTYAEYCYRNSATVRRLVQSPTLQWTIFCGCPSDLRDKGYECHPLGPSLSTCQSWWSRL